tara:strand:+ start:672 stop:854 length:183 start_codon:yes stop_codon:yes gene_type:complete
MVEKKGMRLVKFYIKKEINYYVGRLKKIIGGFLKGHAFRILIILNQLIQFIPMKLGINTA